MPRKASATATPAKPRPATSRNDRLEIAFTSDVSGEIREDIRAAIEAIATDNGCWLYPGTADKSGTIRLEITAHDRTTFDLTDGQIVERLRIAARADGMTVAEMLRKLAIDD